MRCQTLWKRQDSLLATHSVNNRISSSAESVTAISVFSLILVGWSAPLDEGAESFEGVGCAEDIVEFCELGG